MINSISRKNIFIFAFLLIAGIAMIGLGVKTCMDIKPLPRSLSHVTGVIKKPRLVDRHGIALTTTYTGTWNFHDQKPLHDMPSFLQKAFIFSEDRRFYDHGGVDWLARCHALFQNITAGRAVRGASTITEQVVRLIHPRPRTVWSRWIEGFEARQLEKTNTKLEILCFYLNQVPYASHRRGVAQAARFYFDRDVDSLNLKESMALAVLVRAPDYYDLYRHPGRIKAPLKTLATAMEKQKILTPSQCRTIATQAFELKRPALAINAPHFVRFVLNHHHSNNGIYPEKIHTTLDGGLQKQVQTLLDTNLASHRDKKVHNGAALVVDHATGEILAWAVGADKGKHHRTDHFSRPRSNKNQQQPATAEYPKPQKIKTHGQAINAATALRQPGSAMKPFVYAMALEKGWTAATLIRDSPLAARVGMGVHAYHNYSGHHYGPVTLRNALGNSLNIPAVRAIQFVGVKKYLIRLRSLGFTTLNQHPDFYGDGLALGNGEVSLYELIQAYTVLANQGRFIALRTVSGRPVQHNEQIFSKEVTSLMGHILSDAGARTLEFGRGGLLNFPVQTAVKTGTSSDYKDAWAMGYNCNFTVGVWMGNLNGSATRGMTGSRGPAFVLRSIFARLNQMKDTRPLYMSPRLVQQEISIDPMPPGPGKNVLSKSSENRSVRTEWFIPGSAPVKEMPLAMAPPIKREKPEQDRSSGSEPFRFIQPLNGMCLAMDPRIPDDREVLACQVAGTGPNDALAWCLDGRPLTITGSQFNWQIQPGRHVLEIAMRRSTGHEKLPGKNKIITDRVQFLVK
ncbi:penicillin-binding protein 1C [Desulfocicer vacuolatum DSM 3385]|uniref:peptidoglycan glycosyltransferase n=1 Tax=Desulfocicer vacuolatum DSM 3385 TaxID=1121400 RepID=A0A1W2E7K5_9BACT|nr:transglycosylase domain-containing protein [Desulfocicer vacuolatum]SMD05760.1 penicillin-binding protein 1C [Desulfocicer vacuolatum DSM 3385]